MPFDCSSHRYMEPLFPDPTRGCQDNSMTWLCAAAGVFVVYLLMQQPPIKHHVAPYVQPPVHAIATMFTKVVHPLSARQSITTQSELPPAGESMPELFQNKKNVLACDAAEPISTEKKKEMKTKLETVLKDGSKVCMVIFAHWCPHCKTTLKELASEAGTSDLTYVIVNGEAVDPSAFQGPGAIVELKHYPTILACVDGKKTEVPSLAKAAEVLQEKPVKKEDPVAAATDDAVNESTETMLAKLF